MSPLLVVFFSLAAAHCVHAAGAPQEVFAWKQVDYAWPSEQFKNEAVRTGAFVPENNLPLGLALWKNKLFITVPRWKSGVASSLNYVNIDQANRQDKSPRLIPYPSWDANFIPNESNDKPAEASTGGRDNAPKAEKSDLNTLKDNSTVVSVFRLWVDKCDRLWVMDTGLADVLGSPKILATPSLLIFDLNTDQLIRRYFFKDNVIKENSFLANVVVDVARDTCDDAYAYVPDLGGYGLVVYSLKEDRAWRVKHHFFHFDPLAGEYSVGGVNFQWTDGIFGVALSKRDPVGTRRVFFHALSSTKEFEVPNKLLQNETWATSPTNFHEFRLVGERGPKTQASANYFDEGTGVLFFTQVNRDGVGCWNSAKPMTPENIGLIASSAEQLEFPNDLKVDPEGINVWILSDKLPKFVYSDLDQNIVNYRILTMPVNEAIRDTPCAL